MLPRSRGDAEAAAWHSHQGVRGPRLPDVPVTCSCLGADRGRAGAGTHPMVDVPAMDRRCADRCDHPTHGEHICRASSRQSDDPDALVGHSIHHTFCDRRDGHPFPAVGTNLWRDRPATRAGHGTGPVAAALCRHATGSGGGDRRKRADFQSENRHSANLALRSADRDRQLSGLERHQPNPPA